MDKDNVPSRIAARGGLGAVMGSKGLKAIVIDTNRTKKPRQVNPDEFNQVKQTYTKALLKQPQTIIYRDFGTAAMANLCNQLGGLPTRGFSSGSNLILSLCIRMNVSGSGTISPLLLFNTDINFGE